MTESFLFSLAWKGTAVLGAAFAGSFALRGRSAATRRLVWSLAMLALLAVPALEFVTPRIDPPAAIVAARVETIALREIRPGTPAPAPPFPWKRAAVYAWAAGCALALARIAASRWAAARLIARGRRVDGVVESTETGIPFSAGAFWPKIVVPAGWSEWPEERRRAVLLHEQAHVAAGDNFWRFVAQLACAVHWFHPLAWLAARRLTAEQEQACDDAVLASGMLPSDYATHLLEIARFSPGFAPWRPAAAPMAARSLLKPRIAAILAAGRRRNLPTRKQAAVGALVCAACVLPLAAMRPDSSDGSIQGLITANGSPMAGAAVVLVHVETMQRFERRTDAAGLYKLDRVPAGSVELYVHVPGYSVRALGSAVQSGAPQRRDFDLRADPAQPVVVAAQRTLPEPPPARPAGPQRIRVGGNVRPARLVHREPAIYPESERAAGVHGTVVIKAVVRMDGALGGTAVAASPSQGLSAAALEAVSKWRYEPTLLNGAPVETATTVRVTFDLSEK